MTQQNTHRDYFGRPVEVGDILLGAKPGGRYCDTIFSFVIVVSKTPSLLRVHQWHGHYDLSKITKDDVLASLKRRNGRKAGKMVPSNFIKTGVNIGLTQVEMESAIKKGEPSQLVADFVNSSISF